MADTITLGSGQAFVKEFTGTLPEVADMKAAANRIGYIKGGATLSYEPSTYEATDDLGYVKKTIITEEKVTLKLGVMTWDGNTLKQLTDTGRVTTSSDGKTRTVKIGGTGNASNTKYAVLFYHEDATDGDKWVQIVGRNTAGFELTFAKDSETVIDAEFTAEPCDSEGTLVVFGEQVDGE